MFLKNTAYGLGVKSKSEKDSFFFAKYN